MSIVNVQKQSKIQHFNLNLDYLPLNLSVELQTNNIINDKINSIMRKYSTHFREKIFILEYNDDLISVIAYNILSRISDISDLQFNIFGKAKRTKSYIFKKDKKKFISLRKIRKIKDRCIFVSVLNPIYNVIPQNKNFKNLGASLAIDTIKLMENFTPQEMFEAQKFYGIGYINDGLYYKNISLNGYIKWIESPGRCVMPPALHVNDTIKNVYLVWLDENTENNVSVLQDVEQVDDVVMYFIKDGVDLSRMLEPYSKWVKMKSNIPSEEYLNMNNYELAIALCRDYNPIFKGNWETRKREVFEV